MAYQVANGQLVDVPDTGLNITGTPGVANNSFSGIPVMPKQSNVLAGITLPKTVTGYTANPIAGGVPIPTYNSPGTTVQTPPVVTPTSKVLPTKNAVVPTVPTEPRDANGLLINPPGALFDRNTGKALTPTPPTPGSVASIYQVPVDANQAEIDKANTYKEGLFKTETDPKVLYQNMLTEQQARIDSINNVYNDQLNQARIKGQGRLGSTTALNARSGLLGSDIGQANTNVQQDANTDAEKAIENEKKAAIEAVYSKIRSDAVEQAKANTLAKTQGADAIIANAAAKAEKRKSNAVTAIKSLIQGKIKDVSTIPADVLDTYLKGLGLTKDEFTTQFNTELKTQTEAETKTKNEQDKATQDILKSKAETDKLLAEIKQGKWITIGDGSKIYNPETKVTITNPKTFAPKEPAKDKPPTANEVKQFINKQMATSEFKGMSKSQKADFILANGGTPSDYGY